MVEVNLAIPLMMVPLQPESLAYSHMEIIESFFFFLGGGGLDTHVGDMPLVSR